MEPVKMQAASTGMTLLLFECSIDTINLWRELRDLGGFHNDEEFLLNLLKSNLSRHTMPQLECYYKTATENVSSENITIEDGPTNGTDPPELAPAISELDLLTSFWDDSQTSDIIGRMSPVEVKFAATNQFIYGQCPPEQSCPPPEPPTENNECSEPSGDISNDKEPIKSIELPLIAPEVLSKLKCDICAETFHAQVDLLDHYRKHFKTNPLPCRIDKCPKRFSDEDYRLRHELICSRRPPPPKRKDKSRTLPSSKRWKIKQNCNLTPDDSKPFCCYSCGQGFFTIYGFTAHRRNSIECVKPKHCAGFRDLDAPSVKLCCYYCDYSSVSRISFESHLRTHKSKFECRFCKRVFDSLSAKQFHRKKCSTFDMTKMTSLVKKLRRKSRRFRPRIQPGKIVEETISQNETETTQFEMTDIVSDAETESTDVGTLSGTETVTAVEDEAAILTEIETESDIAHQVEMTLTALVRTVESPFFVNLSLKRKSADEDSVAKAPKMVEPRLILIAKKTPIGATVLNWKCSGCHVTFTKHFAGLKHMGTHAQKLKCRHCGLEFTFKGSLMRHKCNFAQVTPRIENKMAAQSLYPDQLAIADSLYPDETQSKMADGTDPGKPKMAVRGLYSDSEPEVDANPGGKENVDDLYAGLSD